MHQHQKKLEYWNHFICKKKYWPERITVKRLEEVLPYILMKKEFWDDVLVRHSGESLEPYEMKGKDIKNYEHCFSNMGAMVLQAMYDSRIIKLVVKKDLSCN